jgi:aminoglycoside phosphotransferase (APT) family kinase protein
MIGILSKEEDFRQRLTEYLEAVLNAEAVEIENPEPMAGGTSRESWHVKAEVKGENRDLVLRRDTATTLFEKALFRDQEFKVMKAAHDSGVNVPCPRWYCIETAILDMPFLIMDYVEGISIGRQVVQAADLADARRAMPGQLGEQLAKIHAVDVKKHDLDFLPAPAKDTTPAQESLAQIRRAIQALGVHNPVFEFGLRWAEQHVPSCEQPVLVHGDFRVGNFLVGSKGLNGIIDWEYSHLGDPSFDIAWICLRDWRYGNGDLQLGGIAPTRDTFIQAYERVSGRKVDTKAVEFWEIVGNLRWAVACLSQANRHLSGGESSVELASLGRRSAEMQLEMLRLIGEQGVTDHV